MLAGQRLTVNWRSGVMLIDTCAGYNSLSASFLARAHAAELTNALITQVSVPRLCMCFFVR